MKIKYPVYALGELQKLEKKLSAKNRVILNDFAKFCLIKAGEKKVEKIKRHLVQFLDVTEKNLYDLTKEDIDSFLVILNQSERSIWTKKEIKVYLKKFLKWYYRNNFELIENIKCENPTDLNPEKYDENKLLTEEDVEKMLRYAENFKEKAFLFSIFETGGRPQELINLKWSDVKFDSETADLTLYSRKTGKSRIFPVKKARGFLWEWKQNYSYPNVKPNDYVFVSRWREKPVTTSGLNRLLRRLSKRSGLNKNVWSYLIRHSRANKLYEELPQLIVEKLMGHKNMAGVYAHISNKKAREVMLDKIYKIEKLTITDKKELKKLKEEIEKIKTNNTILFNKYEEVMTYLKEADKVMKSQSKLIEIKK